MTDIEKVEQKIMVLVKRREKIEGDIKKLTAKAKQLEKGTAALEVEKKRLLCGRFGELLEKNAILIQDVDLDEIVKAISANKDVYKAKNIKAALADEAEAAGEVMGNIGTDHVFSQTENSKINGEDGVVE